MKVLAVSGTRADWGLLCPVLLALKDRGVDVVLALTGQHLSPDGDQGRAVAASGFPSFHRIDMGLTSDDSPRATGAAMGLGLSGMARMLAEVRPDLLLVLGDRYEMLAMVAAALPARVPVAHIAGGDVTEGAFDDAIRHAITKLSALHFATNAEARTRLLQMGEAPERVFLTGSPGIDTLLQTPKLDRATLFADLGLDPDRRPVFLVTFHPPTLSDDAALQCRALLAALDQFPDASVIATGSNADPGAREIDALMQAWVSMRNNAVFRTSLGSQRYVSALAQVDVVIGNSSSGLYEAPSFGVPTVNVGDRQARRPRAVSVVDCAAETGAIVLAIGRALAMGRQAGVTNPFGDGNAAPRIADIIAGLDAPAMLIRKSIRAIAS